jgi:hypothetical protein
MRDRDDHQVIRMDRVHDNVWMPMDLGTSDFELADEAWPDGRGSGQLLDAAKHSLDGAQEPAATTGTLGVVMGHRLT